MGLSARGHRLVLWRHGQTVWNLEERFQGQTDIPLDETGMAQAERAARLLATLRPEAIISSDLERAADTAEALSRVVGVPVALDVDLRERHVGAWEGLTRAEIERRYPRDWAARKPADGEADERVAERVSDAVLRALEKLVDAGDGRRTLVVVSHGAALRLGMSRLLDLPTEIWSRIGPLANCSWSVLGEGYVGWRLLEHNAGTLPEPVLSDDR